VLLALAAVLLATLAVVAVVAPGSGSRAKQGAGVPAGDTTASVERRTLVEHAQVDGTLGYGAAVELYDRESGTFTWLPSVGSVIARGGTLWRVNNLPVVLMYGSVPAYRALKQGVSDGPDVTQLNANLVALGFDPYRAIGDHAHFGEATAAAVRRWQAAEGLPQTGEVELGRVVFAPTARRVTALHVALGQDPPGATNTGQHSPSHHRHDSSPKAPAKHHPHQPRKNSSPSSSPSNHASANNNKNSHGNNNNSHGNGPGNGSDPNNNSNKEGSGSGGGAAMLVLSTTSTQQLVQLQVKATQQQLARVGESAPVTLPNGSSVQGRITAVGTVATESSGEGEKGNNHGSENSSGSGENATIAVTLTLDHPVARLDKAPVSVELVKETRRDVLAVPATALLATGGGAYAIQTLQRGHRVEVPVTPGMFANGYVQVEGPGVYEGLVVLEPQ
jgi:peptidoglycan hydrolase-like protein with peptidoglycan-binding domain